MSSGEDEEDDDYVPEIGLDESDDKEPELGERVVIRTAEEEKSRKRKVDDLWAEMNKPAVASGKPPQQASTAVGWSSLMPGRSGTTRPGLSPLPKDPQPGKGSPEPPVEQASSAAAAAAAAMAKMKSMDATASVGASPNGLAQEQPESKTGDLTSLLADIKGKKPSTISKSREDWKFLKEKEETVDELNAHKKDKNRYTDRIAFLQRAELREHENEKARKTSRRG